MTLLRAILMGLALSVLARCGVMGAPKNYVDVHPENPPVEKKEAQ